MATRTWSAAAAGNWNVDANWSGGAVPTVDDDVVFDATSTYGCTVDISPSINSYVATSAYTGNISFSGQTLTVALGFSDDGTGTRNYGNGITANGASSTVHFGATLGAVTANTTTLTFNGTTGMTLDDDKGLNGTFSSIKAITLGPSAKLTLAGGASVIGFNNSSTIITLGNSAELTWNQDAQFILTSSLSIWSVGSGAVWKGTGNLLFRAATDGITISMPELMYTGSGVWTIENATAISNTTFQLTGNVNIGLTSTVQCFNSKNSTNLTVNLNSYNLTCNSFRPGATSTTAIYTLNCGASGSITCNTFLGQNAVYTTGSCALNLQGKQINCAGNLTFGANHTVNPGTATISITNTSTATTNNKSVYNFVINAAGKTITLADTLTIATGGSITVTAFTAFAGNQHIVFAGSGSITISTAVSNSLRTAVAGSTITWNTGANTWTIPAYTASDWGGTSGSYGLWRSSTPGSQYKISAPAGVAIGYMDIRDCNNTGTLIDAKTTTNTDSGNNLGFDFAVVIDTVSPGSGVTGTTVTISGHSFLSPQGSGKVEFIIGGLPVAAASYVSWTDTEIIVTTPAGSGAADVKVTSSDGDTATAAAAFTMQVPVVGENRMDIGLFLGL